MARRLRCCDNMPGAATNLHLRADCGARRVGDWLPTQARAEAARQRGRERATDHRSGSSERLPIAHRRELDSTRNHAALVRRRTGGGIAHGPRHAPRSRAGPTCNSGGHSGGTQPSGATSEQQRHDPTIVGIWRNRRGAHLSALGGSRRQASRGHRCNAPSVPASDAPARAEAPSQVERVLLQLLQQQRRKAGLKPLTVHDKLTAIARAHSLDMASSGFFGHRSRSTGAPDDRVRKAGISTRLVRENCGRGASGTSIHQDFVRSPGHRAVLLDSRVSHVGIGAAPHPDGFLVTQVMVTLP